MSKRLIDRKTLSLKSFCNTTPIEIIYDESATKLIEQMDAKQVIVY